jgi:hypothetical protein
MAMLMRSVLNLSAAPMEVYCQRNIPGGILLEIKHKHNEWNQIYTFDSN